MKVTAPSDLSGRLIRCKQRANPIFYTLLAFAYSDMKRPDDDSMKALADVAEELSDELQAIDEAYNSEGTRTDLALAAYEARQREQRTSH
jgi:hypothetical protein